MGFASCKILGGWRVGRGLMLVFLFVTAVIALVTFWLGKAVRYNRELRADQLVRESPELDPDALVDLRTGEILEPGTKKWAKAAKKAYVRFE